MGDRTSVTCPQSECEKSHSIILPADATINNIRQSKKEANDYLAKKCTACSHWFSIRYTTQK